MSADLLLAAICPCLFTATVLAALLLYGFKKPAPAVRPWGTYCTDKVACNMRRKLQLIPVSLDEAACGVPDSAVADFMVWEAKASTGQSVLMFRNCPWCGERWHWQGKIVIRTEPE